MITRKRWMITPLFLVALSLAVLGCSQSDGTGGSQASAANAKAGTAPGSPSNATEPSTAASSSPPATLTLEATGQVISADSANKTLVLQSDAGAIAFEVQDRVASELQGLRTGDKVTVRYIPDAGKNLAEAIQKG